jgi:hypothetical protein
MLLALLTLSGLVMVEAVSAQTTPRPSVPEFTVKLVDRSYDVPLTYTNSTDPYTGQQVTITNGGYHVENITIDVTIKNQPFTSSNIDGNTTQLFYAIRWKGHFENWADTYHISGVDYNYYLSNYGIPASNSEYTVKIYTMASFENVPEGGQIDFQVKAQVGYSFAYYGDHAPIMPIGTVFQSVEESVWSNTQTITLGEFQTTSPEPTIPTSPTPMPDEEPQLAEQGVILDVAIALSVLGAGLVLLVYLIKKK